MSTTTRPLQAAAVPGSSAGGSDASGVGVRHEFVDVDHSAAGAGGAIIEMVGHRLPGFAVGSGIVSAAEQFDLGVDAYASTEPGPFDDEVLDPCGCRMSVSYGHSQGEAVPRPLRASAAIDWLVERNPLTITTWNDPVVEAVGHHVRSVYVETFWLPTLGPSATWLIRRLACWLEADRACATVELPELAAELGLGAGTGRSSPIIRTLARLAQFQAAAPAGDAYAVRRHLAPLPRRLANQLPNRLAVALEREDGGG